MADFKTHITTSTVLGIGYGFTAWYLWDVPLQHSLVAAGLCSLAGMLPDLDSDTGVPVRETLCFVSVLVPMLMLRRFEAMGMSPEQIVFAAALIYLGLRFGVGAVFKRYTKHRGMWHSVPAAIIAGLVTWVVCLSPEVGVRLLKSCAVVLGFLSHLVLDEIYSVDLYGRRIKRSFGTALKFFGRSRWANFSTYAKLALLTLIVMGDARFMGLFNAQPIDLQSATGAAQEWVGELIPVAQEHLETLRR
jgi:hypothetical protein